VNPHTDHRPTDNTVTKEPVPVTSLRRRLDRLVSSINRFAAVGGDGDAPSADGASVEPSNGRRQEGRVAALLARPRTLRCAVLAAAVLVLGAVEASPAGAAEPWWNLDTSIRPAVINEGGEATIYVRAANLGNACTVSSGPGPDGKSCTVDDEGIVPTALTATLPEGMEIVEEVGEPKISIFANSKSPLQPIPNTSAHCRLSGRQVSCETEVPEAFIEAALARKLGEEPFKGFIEREESFCSQVGTCKSFYEGIFGPQIESEFPPVAPIAPYEYFEMRLRVRDVGAASGAQLQTEVSGGGATPLSRSRALPLGPGATPFGVEQYELRPEAEGGAVDPRAGAHPYQLTATFNLDQNADERNATQREAGEHEIYARPPAMPRNLHFRLPPGQLGNATTTPKCSAADFTTFLASSANNCPPDTAIGVALLTIYEPSHVPNGTFPVPLFNLEPAFGEPARFGFELAAAPIILDTAVRSGKAGTADGDYGVTVSVSNTTQLANFISSTVTFWGTPGDPTHDNARGWGCLSPNYPGSFGKEANLPCQPENQQKPPAFLTLPTDCSTPFASAVEGDSWTDPTHTERQFLEPLAGADPFSLIGCNQLPFSPTIHSEPTSNAATSPTGLGFEINFEDEGLLSSKPGARAQSQMKKAVVSLPEGFTTNPSVAEGLKACSEAEYESSNLDGSQGCNQESKVGEVEIQSPLVEPTVHGSIYVAKQKENPNGNLLTLYMVARNPEIGVIIKQALKVEPNPVTGQLTTEVDNVPQLPFSHFKLFFRPGQRAPLVTPPACGSYTVKALLYPWSNPTAPVERESSFQITSGPEGQGCPSGGVPPFHPVLQAGSENPTAGAYSPFYTDITRKDSEQEITRFSIKLPTGMIAKLKGVSECSDAQIALAKSREVEGGGTVEQEHPACPSGSEVGHTQVGTGVGNVLAYAPGKLYLAGPYHGSPISLVSVTAAKVGPFDLGTVVVRFALDVNHETAEVSVDGANSDPIPHIVDGIPVHLRDIQAFVDRPNFTLNPTSCAKKSTASTVLGSGLNFASSSDDVPVTVSSPFQVASCASLGFAPKLALNLVGKKTHRGALPAFKAVLTYPKGGAYANIAKAQVTLPKSEFLEQGHLKNVCTRKVFETGANPGENCPANSIYGKARAVTPLLDQPLEGPVYLRTGYGTRLPELAAALNGPQISITLAGTIDSVHKKGTEGSQIRNTFALVPDAPVEKFTLELKGGKKGLLVNSTDVCKGTHKALAAFTGQNGKLSEAEPALKAQCGKGKKKSGAKKKNGKPGKKGGN
jgi:hypothetical protein